MKKAMLAASVLAVLAVTGPDQLTGKWETKPSPKGNITGVVFKEDQSFDGYVNKKPFTSGTYHLEDSTFELVDNGCNGATGKYRIIFFSNNDSFRLRPIDDPCEERKNGMSKLVMGRVKQ